MSASYKEISNILAAIASATVQVSDMALATVVDVEGSAYRRTGARMLVQRDGHWTGSISGGCLEGHALRTARQVMDTGVPQRITYDTRTDADARVLGASLGCNGVIQVWLEPLGGQDVRETLYALKDAFWESAESWFGRVLKGPADQVGKLVALAESDGRMMGLGMATPLSEAASRLTLLPGLQRVQSMGVDWEWAVERVVPATRLLIVGAGEDAKPLCHLAHEMGWRVTVADECAAKALPVRFPEAERLVHVERAQLVRTVAPNRFTAVVLMSHNYGLDKAVLADLLGTDVPYIGILGPRKRYDRLVDELGAALAERAGVHAPVGLDIGAQTPFEIAIAVVAEIQAVMHGRPAGHLRMRQGRIHDDERVQA